MRRSGTQIGAVILIVCVVFGMRIWAVNHSEELIRYNASKKVYPVGTDVCLSNTAYYVDWSDLSGYHMKVTETELMRTVDFLEIYDMTIGDLEKIVAEDNVEFDNYELIFLVTVDFYNEKWDEQTDASILLNNFLLVGPDYYIMPATGSVHLIPDFNPELNGAVAFSIKIDRTFEVTLPYLIDTKSETGLSKKYFLGSSPELLIAVYPEECYLELPIS